MSLRASLAARLPPAAVAARPLLAAGGARLVLGAAAAPRSGVAPVAASATSLFGPRGVALAGADGPLLVCDTGHHRLLVWRRVPAVDHAPADFVIGQRDFATEGRNGRGAPGAATLNVPTGVAIGDGVLAVADAWNHRVLLWRGFPSRSNTPADVVLGQADTASVQANRGAAAPGAGTLNGCSGVLIHDGALIVADTLNRRVLVWRSVPESSGAPADLVLGQPDFATRDAGAGDPAATLRWPHGLAAGGGMLFVADAGAGRVLGWRLWPRADGAPAELVIGQADARGFDHNRGAVHPAADSLNMPYAVATCGRRLVVADTANSRLVGFPLDAPVSGAPATHLAGQREFHDKGDNRWGGVMRDSLCWPYGIAACGTTVAIADSGNNRVLLWDAS